MEWRFLGLDPSGIEMYGAFSRTRQYIINDNPGGYTWSTRLLGNPRSVMHIRHDPIKTLDEAKAKCQAWEDQQIA